MIRDYRKDKNPNSPFSANKTPNALLFNLSNQSKQSHSTKTNPSKKKSPLAQRRSSDRFTG
jgi:hypothetical protein